MSEKLTVTITPTSEGFRLVSNNHAHGKHDESNPDDGSVSPEAVELAGRLVALGFSATVKSLE